MTPDYWLRAKRALARRDAVLARIIRAHPRIALSIAAAMVAMANTVR